MFCLSNAHALTLVSLACVLALAACAPRGGGPRVVKETTPSAPATESTPSTASPANPWPEVGLEEAYTGLDQPLQVTNAGDGSGRLFVVEKTGRIRVIRDGKLLDAPFLDISGKVSTGSEQGLLCVAFAPDYKTSGVFYVDYTDTAGDTHVARFRVSANDADRAEASLEELVLKVDQPYANHNGGQLLFDGDGNLLVGMGDGGSGGDPHRNGQNRKVLLGKILRLRVGGSGTYTIPPDNPYADGRDGFRPEIWAYGLRNPWRFSLDPQTGDLYIGDVGQDEWEEIDAVSGLGRPGANYGWNLLEGTHPYPPGSPAVSGLGRFVMPVVEYGHDIGESVTGGLVYRGSRYPDLRGMYVYADFVSGRLWGMRGAPAEPETRQLADTSNLIASFGYAEDGEIYVADLGGKVLHVTAR